MTTSAITPDLVRDARDELLAAGKPAGLRAVHRAIAARTGHRPSFATLSRLLAALPPPASAPAVEPIAALTEQFARGMPDLWRAAVAHAEQRMAADLAALTDRATRAEDDLRDLADEHERVTAVQADLVAERDRQASAAQAAEVRAAEATADLRAARTLENDLHAQITRLTAAHAQAVAEAAAHATERDRAIVDARVAQSAAGDAAAERQGLITMMTGLRQDLEESRAALDASRRELGAAQALSQDREHEASALRLQIGQVRRLLGDAEVRAARAEASLVQIRRQRRVQVRIIPVSARKRNRYRR